MQILFIMPVLKLSRRTVYVTVFLSALADMATIHTAKHKVNFIFVCLLFHLWLEKWTRNREENSQESYISMYAL